MKNKFPMYLKFYKGYYIKLIDHVHVLDIQSGNAIEETSITCYTGGKFVNDFLNDLKNKKIFIMPKEDFYLEYNKYVKLLNNKLLEGHDIPEIELGKKHDWETVIWFIHNYNNLLYFTLHNRFCEEKK